MALPSTVSITPAKQAPILIPLWDKGNSSMSGQCAFLNHSLDAVLSRNVTYTTSTYGLRVMSAENQNLTVGGYENFSNAGGSAISLGGLCSQNGRLGSANYNYGGGANTIVTAYGTTWQINSGSYPKSSGTISTSPSVGAFNAGNNPQIPAWLNLGLGVKNARGFMFGAIVRMVNELPGAYFMGGSIGAIAVQGQITGVGSNNTYPGFAARSFSPFANVLLGQSTETTPNYWMLSNPSGLLLQLPLPGLEPTTLTFADATIVPGGTAYARYQCTPLGFLLYSGNTITDFSTPIIVTYDGSRYWPLQFQAMTTAAQNVLNAITNDIAFDSSGVIHVVQTNIANGGLTANVPPGQTVPTFTIAGGSVINPYQPLRGFTLPCNDFCANPPLSIGRKVF